MKVYVDELPKSCGDCVFCKQTEYYYYCDKLSTKLGYIDKDKDCPLQSLAEYTKQVRKEMCDEIRSFIEKPENSIYWDCSIYVETEELRKLLDQIQGNN